MSKKIGNQTLKLDTKPKLISTYSIVGPKEGEGPLNMYFDKIVQDDLAGKDSFEKAESNFLYTAVTESIKNANLEEKDIDILFAGDLLNQLSSSSFAARDMNIPFIGLYGACSTMSESLAMASMTIDGGFCNNVVAATSSHFSAAERQFRYPLEFGAQRPPTAQWTVTGSGAIVVGKEGNFPYVTYVTIGKVKDYGVTDANNMGASMVPAAVSTIYNHFKDTGRTPKDYDVIATGDLGRVGKKITLELLKEQGYDITSNYIDCGDEIFNHKEQGTASGGSGCGCSAVVFCGYLYRKLMEGKFKRVLLVSTGALLSTTSSLQGESIPGIAHAISIEYGTGGE